jgi:hypothetical protein
MSEVCRVGAGLGAALGTARGMAEPARAAHAKYELQCIGKDGLTRWQDQFSNLVVTAGRDDLLTQYFKGIGYTASWHVGLIDNGGFASIAASDTMASHAGWAESTAYSNANRAALVLGSASAASIDNAASTAAFAINAAATIRGAFIASSNVKGGSSGLLYSAGTFAASRAVSPGDTLNITVTLTAD